MKKKLIVATRKSRLALAQTNLVCAHLIKQNPDIKVELLEVSTQGDRWLETPLYNQGGKGLFVKELEEKILDGTADFAVHSVKDMPYQMPDGLLMDIVLPRASPLDVLVTKNEMTLDTLPDDSVVGTSSLRRHYQLIQQKPKSKILPLRGNIHTRIKKLLNNEYDAIILAEAGINRVNDLPDCFVSQIPASLMLPACGQGALAAQFRVNDSYVRDLLTSTVDGNTKTCILAERAVVESLEAGCHTPVAGFAYVEGKELKIEAWVGGSSGEYIKVSHSGDILEPKKLGKQCALSLIEKGARDFL